MTYKDLGNKPIRGNKMRNQKKACERMNRNATQEEDKKERSKVYNAEKNRKQRFISKLFQLLIEMILPYLQLL